MSRESSKDMTKDEVAEWQITYDTNADYKSLIRDLGLDEEFQEDEEVLEYIEYARMGGKGESLIIFTLNGFPGLSFQLSPKSTLNIFICFEKLEKLFEPILIVKDKILKPQKSFDRVYFSYKGAQPIGRKAAYKYLKEAVKSIQQRYRDKPYDMWAELHEILSLFNDGGVLVFLKDPSLLRLGFELEKDGLIDYHWEG